MKREALVNVLEANIIDGEVVIAVCMRGVQGRFPIDRVVRESELYGESEENVKYVLYCGED